MINWLPTPGIDVCSCKCLEISQGLVQEMNVKSTYLPHYCSVKSSLSAGVWGSEMQLTSALHTLYFALCCNGRSCSTTFPECPWVYTQSVWTFWIRDMIWLPNVLWMTCESKRHFKMVLISQWCFARQWFLFLSSFCFAVVVLVLCFVKVTVMKRGERCNSTYLVNRKGDNLLWRRKARFEVAELKQLAVFCRRCVTKELRCFATDKSRW